MTIYLATENAGKIRELGQLLSRALPHCVVRSLADLKSEARHGYVAEETGSSYAENAMIKARALAAVLPDRRESVYILSDDSGFEVDALGGAPGVYAARFAADDAARCEKILQAVGHLPLARRRARFVACLVLLEGGKNPLCFFGRKEGFIAESARGKNGFGYDPIFCPEAGGPTWGEVDAAEKNRDSHRARALDLVIHYLAGVVNG